MIIFDHINMFILIANRTRLCGSGVVCKSNNIFMSYDSRENGDGEEVQVLIIKLIGLVHSVLHVLDP